MAHLTKYNMDKVCQEASKVVGDLIINENLYSFSFFQVYKINEEISAMAK